MQARIVEGQLEATTERLRKLSARRIEKLAVDLGNLAERKADQYAEGKTPGVTYEATVSTSGGDFPIDVELVAQPDSAGADINMRIAIGGRKAYDIYPRFKKALAWPSDRPTKSSKQGKYIHLPRGRGVHIPAKPPILPRDFIQTALKNALAEVRNRYR
jgi:hypothetical protein